MEEINKILNDFLYEYLDNSLNDKRTATGNLATNGKPFVHINGQVYTIGVSMEDYWKWAENGRKPSKFPPIEKIKEWIRIKPVLPRQINGKLPTENQLAYLISRKIAIEGTEGSHLFEKTINEFDLIAKLYDAVANIIMSKVKL